MEIGASSEIIKKNLFRTVFLSAVFLELASFFTWYVPEARPIFLGLAGAFAAFLAVRHLRGLAMLVVLEGVIASHGHLFWMEIGGFTLTFRMILFALLVAGWGLHLLRGGHRQLARPNSILAALVIVVMAVLWGVARGLAEGRGLGTVFADANAYAFLLLIPIFLDLFRTKEDLRPLTKVFAAGLLWLAIKSLFLVYAFSHALDKQFRVDLRLWQRNYWLTEITVLPSGWVRVFAASDLFLTIGAFASGLMLHFHPRNRKVWAWAAFIIAAFLASMSRSLWLGAVAADLMLSPFFFYAVRGDWRPYLRTAARGILAIVLALMVILFFAKFPAPKRFEFGTDALGTRLTDVSDAAVSSRWKMLPPLKSGISAHPVFGSGFGAAITYQSDDPRIHDLYEDGIITTPAIEWQYLEIWYKMGLLGVLAIAWLFVAVGRAILSAIRRSEGEDRGLVFVIALSFVAFVIANVFTPYINHPLGWLYLTLLLTGAQALGQPSVASAKSG